MRKKCAKNLYSLERGHTQALIEDSKRDGRRLLERRKETFGVTEEDFWSDEPSLFLKKRRNC